jgi:hypothetical protein
MEYFSRTIGGQTGAITNPAFSAMLNDAPLSTFQAPLPVYQVRSRVAWSRRGK